MSQLAGRLISILMLLIGAVLLNPPVVQASAVLMPEQMNRRLDAACKFIKGDPANAQNVDFDDSRWQSIVLPHTWNAEDGAVGKSYYRGPGWYRIHHVMSSELNGMNVFLRFGAAALVAHVYVNGQDVGTHNGGFAAFCFDVTKFFHAGDNLITVRVNNAINPDVPPLSGDFTIYGGLYRPVDVLYRKPIGISPLDDGSSGVYLRTSVTDAVANVNITTKLRNGTSHDAKVQVVCTVEDASNVEVAHCTINQNIPANSFADAVGTLSVEHPHLWNGRVDPYLYHARIEVILDGLPQDGSEQPLGFRYFKVDPEQGLLLNGKPYDFHGVDLHQGRPSVGFAGTGEMIEEDYKLVAEMGCNGVRMAHYQHNDYEYEQCDRLGLVVWAELALVNRQTDSPQFHANAQQQLRELIKQGYNHPSIFFWSMYNEPWVDARNGTQEQWHFINDLAGLAHTLDSTRLTTGAAQSGLGGPILWYMDVTGMNKYYGWYDGKPGDWAGQLAKLHRQYPDKSIGISEYGAGASVMQHEPPVVQPTTGSHWHPEEWQSLVHENAWAAMKDQHWLWCKLVWCMFDFGSAGRNEGDHGGINDKGLVTADRKTRKDAFFFYKANWNPDPMIYITERRFEPRPVGKCDLKVYSNCDSVELWVNDKSMGLQNSESHVFVWPEVDLAAGKAQVRAVGTNHGQQISDSVTWTISDLVKPTTHPALRPASQ